MRPRPLFTAFLVALAWLAPACTAHVAEGGGFPTYLEIAARSGPRSYGLASGAPAHERELLVVALAYWNQALGGGASLKLAPDLATADVKVTVETVQEMPDHPAHTQMLGCMAAYEGVADCAIKLEIPANLGTVEAMTKIAHLFRQGELDQALYARWHYTDVAEYLRDKLVVLALVHEIGHSLGLAHASDPACVMAAVPAGDGHFCPAELEAARTQLRLGSGPPSMITGAATAQPSRGT